MTETRPRWLRRRWPLPLIWVGLVVVLAIVNIGASPGGAPTALDKYIDSVLTVPVWSPVADFVRRNQAGLLASLLLSLMLEFAGRDRELTDIGDEIRAIGNRSEMAMLQSRKPADLMMFALTQVYGTQRPLASLMNAVLSTRPTFWDGILRYRFSEIAGDKNGYLLEVTRQYSLRSDAWVLCLTDLNAVAEAAATALPEICEMMNLSNLSDSADVMDNYQLWLLNQKEGIVTRQRVTMERVSLNMLRSRVPAEVSKLDGQVELWRGKFGTRMRRDDGTYRILVEFRSRMSIDDHSFQWLVDRPLHLLEVEMDARSFGGTDGSRRFYVQYNLLSSIDASEFKRSPGHYVMPLDRWMPQGTGAVLVWRE